MLQRKITIPTIHQTQSWRVAQRRPMRSQTTKALRVSYAHRYSTSNSQKRTSDRTNENHRRDVTLDVGTLDLRVRVVVNEVLEVLGAESTANETFVDTTGRAEQTERDDTEPETPVEDALRLAEFAEAEDVDGLLDAACHCRC